MRPTTPTIEFSAQAPLSSPPETPTTSAFTAGRKAGASHPYRVAQNFSRPISSQGKSQEEVRQGRHFSYHPSIRPEDLSPRSSSPSSDSSHGPTRSLSSESLVAPYTGSSQTTEPTPKIRGQNGTGRNRNSTFTIEEMPESDVGRESDDAISVVHPDKYEDAASDAEPFRLPQKPMDPIDIDAHMLADDLEQLNCDGDRDTWKLKVRQQRRRRRMNSGSIHKRTLSQSIGSDTDDEDIQPPLLDDANEAGSSARRLRRKMEGERTSLIFDDPPQRILELEEPDSDVEGPMNVIPPDVDPDVEEVLMHALPYYDDGDSDSMMEIDSDDDLASL
ncbi:MAG: hypothetical protein M1818_007929 [Claussenomyces sp. TS43310]|nr:MAG: hypothetical protein M1818_007929 [Claussenomyces sp. TS43310]